MRCPHISLNNLQVLGAPGLLTPVFIFEAATKQWASLASEKASYRLGLENHGPPEKCTNHLQRERVDYE